MASAFALIINIESFDDKNISPRVGSLNDVQLLKRIFYKFCFRVALLLNPTLANIQRCMNKSLIVELDEASCLFVVLMTHGAQHDCAYAKDVTFNITKEILNSQAFQQHDHLPKIVLVQACKEALILEDRHVVCATKNILRFDSTFEGRSTIRMHGYSQFIASFCDILDKFGLDLDIDEIINKTIDELERKNIKRKCDYCPTKHIINGTVHFCAAHEIKKRLQELHF